MVFVAAGAGVVVFDTTSNQFVAHLFDPNERGTVEVAVSPDSRYVAASDEQAGLVTVFNVADRSLVAQVPVAPFPVGLAFTPDGRALLATSQLTSNGAASGTDQSGVLQVIDTKSWTIRDTVSAGCGPVRVAVGPTGRTWVTARGSNAVLEFDTKRLKAGAANALLAWIRVGPAPVGVTVAADGKRVVVANSNRFVAPESPSTLSVIDARGPRGKPTLIRTVATQAFPRDVTVSPDGNTVITSCFGSGTIDIVSLASRSNLNRPGFVEAPDLERMEP
jgi:DNA-binding beta-propeller fold protein YncE